MPKVRLGVNVLEASRGRIQWAFDRFEKVYTSFSAGKDSTVMLHLVMAEAKKRNRRVGVLLVDLEGQYKLTVEHAEHCFDFYREWIEPYWVALPIHLRNAVSVYEPFWQCWDPDAREAWIREPPRFAITDHGYFDFFHRGMEFEEFVPLFGEWYSKGKLTACLVGIRSDESLNRYRTLASRDKETLEGHRFTTRVTPNTFNVYPIYDWRTEDLWIYQGKNPHLPYNRIYDLMWKAGLSIHQARLCQPYGDDQRKNLWLFHLLEPETWGRVVARVNGANGGAMYVQESGNVSGYRRISKPPGHTWKSFAKLLLSSMPEKTQKHFENKFVLHRRWWAERGYQNGIPDEVPYEIEAARKAPSWRRFCKTLLRNDYWCKGLGFTQHKSSAYMAYMDLMRRRREGWNSQNPGSGEIWEEKWQIKDDGLRG